MFNVDMSSIYRKEIQRTLFFSNEIPDDSVSPLVFRAPGNPSRKWVGYYFIKPVILLQENIQHYTFFKHSMYSYSPFSYLLSITALLVLYTAAAPFKKTNYFISLVPNVSSVEEH